jgi:hypothetical protein
MKILRHAVFSVLNGSVTYNSVVIPVADEKRRIPQTANLFIILGAQNEADDNTSDAFMTDSTIDIEIHHKTDYEVSKDAVDDLSNIILELLMPTPSSDGLPVQNLMQITCVHRSSTTTRGLSVTEGGSVISKVITISAKIVQQSG